MFKAVKLTVVALVAATGLAVSGSALAASVGGGTWNYGVGWSGTFGYSDYLHNTKKHSASVENGSTVVRVTQGKGTWAQASLTKIPPTGLSYYWATY